MPIIIKKAPPKSDFPDIPDPRGFGQRAVDFLRSLKHPKSRLPGNAFQLDPWAERIVRKIYGPCDQFGNRLVSQAIIMIPRGNRKTSLGAALSLLHTMGPEAVPNGEVLFTAADQKQAKIGFREAQSIIEAGDESLWRKGYVSRTRETKPTIKLREYRNKIEFPNGSWLEALASDAGTQHGRTPVFVLADEIHAWPKRDLWDVLKTGLVKVPNSLLVVITTAGRGQENIGFEVIDYARRVLRKEIDDPSTLPILFETPANADWRDEKVWKAANPGLDHGYPSISGLRQLAREAEHRPADREAFKQLHLNMWLDYSDTPFVEMQVYDQGNAEVDLDDLKGEPCWLGVDLSSTSDLTVIVAAWRDGKGGFIVHPWFFCPGDNLARRAEVSGQPYVTWAEDGFIEPTSGNVVDYDFVEAKIRWIHERFDVREIAVDPFLARQLMNNLSKDDLPVVEFRQGMLSMGPAVKTLERAILGGQFQHGGHPILRWNFANIVLEVDAAGNAKFSKGKAKDKIDGAVASAMAVARAAAGEDKMSLFDADIPLDLLVW